MSEFKAKSVDEIKAELSAQNASNKLSFTSGVNFVANIYYAPLLQAYTTTRAELETVKVELDRGKWINVSEQKPEQSGTYIIYDSDGIMSTAYYHKSTGYFVNKSDATVTHWQPLPTPPHKN